MLDELCGTITTWPGSIARMQPHRRLDIFGPCAWRRLCDDGSGGLGGAALRPCSFPPAHLGYLSHAVGKS